MIIAIQGYKGSGKDTVALYLKYILGTPWFMHNYKIAKLLNFKPIFNNWHIIRYADNIKKILSIILNVPIKKFEDRDFKENYYVNFNSYTITKSKDNTIPDEEFMNNINNPNIMLDYNLSIRQILQFFGTEIMRKYFGDKIWVNSTLNIKYKNKIISDQRFIVENESLSKIKDDYLIIHIDKPGYGPGLHSSESELTSLLEEKKYDIIIYNNQTLEYLFNLCKWIVYYNI